MAGSGLQEKAIEAVVIMNTAIINLRLYPPTNAMIVKTIDRLYDMLQTIFEEENTLLLAESERSLLISGEPLSQKNREKPQVAIFLMLMINWGIKSIGFNKNPDKRELSLFLEIMGKRQDDVIKGKGLEQIVSEGEMPHIRINQKVYVEMGKNRETVSRLGITDEDIIKYITTDDPDAALDPEKVKEMAKDHERVSRIFQSGMRQLVDRDGTESNEKLSESMLRMVCALDKISDHEEKEELSTLAAKSISDMDADFIAAMMTQNMEGLLENHLFDQIVERIDPEKFELVAGKLHQALDDASMVENGFDSEKSESARQTYQHLMNTNKGLELQHRIEEKQARERKEKEEKENKIREIKEKVHDFLNNFEGDLPDESAAKSLPEMVDTLYSEGKTEMADMIIDRLTGKLQSDHSDIRGAASEYLVNILDHLSQERRTDIMTRYQEPVLTWIKSETVPTSAFRTICMQLKDLTQSRIREQRFADSLPILETFRFIASRQMEKDDQIQSTASDTLKEIVTADIQDILLEELRFDKKGQRNEAGRNLVMTAQYSIKRLLDLLQESEVSSERGLILNLIPEIGPAAAPAVIERIKESAPWYYLRNLVRLLGRVGSEGHAKILEPLMVYDDLRVQKEAFRSINTIGGTFKGKILLNALSGCDDQLKVSVVTTLGSLRHRDAVKPLVELFKSKLNLPEEMKVGLQEKICLALGNIGDREALPFLTEVSKQSGIFGFKSYNPKVKTAAGRAAGMLSKI